MSIWRLTHYIIYAICCSASVTTATDWHFAGVNIAYRKPAIQGPDTLGIYRAGLAVDGNNSGNFDDRSCSHTKGFSTNAYWEVDLQKAYKITGIVMYNRNGYEERLENFIIYGNGTEIIHNSSGSNEYNQSVIHIPLNEERFYSSIMVQIPKNVRLTLCEVEVFTANCGYKNILNGLMKPNQTLYDFNTQVSIVCNEGFKPTEQNITCTNTKEWTNYAPCSRVFCIYPGKPLNGDYIKGNVQNHTTYLQSSLPYDSVITVRCDLGYRSENNESRTCQQDGTWTGEAPVCKKVQCYYPESISNGKYHFQNGSSYQSGLSYYNTTVQVLCDTGYRIEGRKERTCNANQTWSGETKCSLVTCSLSRMLEGDFYGIHGNNGSFILNNNTVSNYSSEIHSICPIGSNLNSKFSSLKCLKSENWSGKKGKCVLVFCRKPDDMNCGVCNYTNDLSFEKIPYSTVVTVVCDEHFEYLNPGYRTRRCNGEGLWDMEQEFCATIQTHTEDTKLALIGGTVSAAVLITSASLIAFLVIYCRRRRKRGNTDGPIRYRNTKRGNIPSNTSAYEHGDRSNDVNISQEATSRVDRQSDSTNWPTEYYNTSESFQFDQVNLGFMEPSTLPATAVKIQDLSDITLSENSAKEKFQKEFEGLPKGMLREHTVSLEPQNKGKNHYKNLYAYDETRVVLEVEDEGDSDYINACFVDGFDKPKKYIASQGPTKKTLNDFWRMIWQSKCCQIVMLTNLHEEGKMKCEQYWPSNDRHTYGRITVKMEQTEPFSQFVIRTFTVQKDGHTDRNVTQFHFTTWPDRGVPKYASSMVHFLSKVKCYPSQGDGPIVVHCSAGVGRTGTFIALDNVTEQGKAMGYVDVAGVVESMRKQRVGAVQTLEQYIFVYQAVTEALMLSSSAMPSAKFPEAYPKLLEMDMKKKKRKISLEFEALKNMSPVAEESQYMSPRLVFNKNKNRYSNVLPVEEYMPSLTKEDGSEDCEYINAVFLPSYKEKKAFIITQTPLESTVEDFWRLIWEHDVHTLVMMNSREEMMHSEVYWPSDDKMVSFGNISITNDGTTTINRHTVLSLTMTKFVLSRHIRLFQVGGWKPHQSLPESTDVILSLMELVQSWQQQSKNLIILVHCMDGVEKSGLFCVISAVIERMKIEQDVAIPQVIEEMRNAREQIIPSVEQFQFCHEAVLAFLQQYDTYSNFSM